MSNGDKEVLLKIVDVSKYFGSVVALKDVSFEVYKNEIIGLVGDNGAGKSTLIKIISGNYLPDSGSIFLRKKKLHFKIPEDARHEGIETVYQDLSLCENLDAVSNLFVGRELYKRFIGFKILQKKDMESRTSEVLNQIDIKIPSIKEKVQYLSGGERQAVSLARFVAWGKNLVLLDEPTAALGVRETRKALDLVMRIRREREISVILISHNLQQVFEVVDRIIVFRHGEVVGIKDKNKTNPDEIVSLITGAILVNGKNN